jgi:hypothetical protein
LRCALQDAGSGGRGGPSPVGYCARGVRRSRCRRDSSAPGRVGTTCASSTVASARRLRADVDLDKRCSTSTGQRWRLARLTRVPSGQSGCRHGGEPRPRRDTADRDQVRSSHRQKRKFALNLTSRFGVQSVTCLDRQVRAFRCARGAGCSRPRKGARHANSSFAR